MEFVRGQTVESFILDETEDSSDAERLRLITELAASLREIHRQGFARGDLNP